MLEWWSRRWPAPPVPEDLVVVEVAGDDTATDSPLRRSGKRQLRSATHHPDVPDASRSEGGRPNQQRTVNPLIVPAYSNFFYPSLRPA